MMQTVAARRGFRPDVVVPTGTPAWLADIKRAAFERFETLGYPTPHDEAWRYTGLQPITSTAWTRSRRAPEVETLPDGVRLRPLTESGPEARRRFATIAASEKNAFTELNTAAFEEAYVLEIAPEAVLERPIEIVFAPPPTVRAATVSPRLLILAGERSQASIVQTFTGKHRTFTNAVTEIALAEGALLEHTLLQREATIACHIHTLAAKQARASRFSSIHVALGGALARTDLHVALEGEGAECELYGLFVGKGAQHLDTHTTIDHASPRCTSRELYKGILDGAARGVFHGTILVRPHAQKTDAVQTNKNLLLSRAALVNSTPALEILADDVKCKHGSTTGQLDPAALFYLRSRGIGEEAARALLTWAFAADVAERIRIPSVRAEVERELGQRLAGAPLELSA